MSDSLILITKHCPQCSENMSFNLYDVQKTKHKSFLPQYNLKRREDVRITCPHCGCIAMPTKFSYRYYKFLEDFVPFVATAVYWVALYVILSTHNIRFSNGQVTHYVPSNAWGLLLIVLPLLLLPLRDLRLFISKMTSSKILRFERFAESK